MLKSIAERTGGRVIELDAVPESIDLFEKMDLEIPLASKRVWDLLAIIAASIFLLDVAVRRLTFDTRAARSAASRAVAGSNSPSGESVVAWKRARSRSRRGSPETTSEPSDRDAAEQPIPVTDFDVDEQRKGGTATRDVQPERDDVPDSGEEASSEDRLARLKRARRRARGEEDA